MLSEINEKVILCVLVSDVLGIWNLDLPQDQIKSGQSLV